MMRGIGNIMVVIISLVAFFSCEEFAEQEVDNKRKTEDYDEYPTPLNTKDEVNSSKIKLHSDGANGLYEYCMNRVTIEAPSLHDSVKLKCSLQGGSITGIPNSKDFIITPDHRDFVLLNVEGVGTRRLAVRPIPSPHFDIYVGRREANRKQGHAAGSVRTITVLSHSGDPFFNKIHKADSAYKVTEYEVMLVRGKRPVNKRTVSGPTFRVMELGDQREGDRLLIEINGVEFENFEKERFEISLEKNEGLFNIPLS